MVDLNLPRPAAAIDETPRSPISANDVYRSANAIGKGVGDLADGLESIGTVFAKRQGEEDARKAVTRNPDGSLTVARPETSFIMGKMGEAYASAQRAELQVSLRSEMDIKLAQFAKENEGNPAEFQRAAAAYVDQRRADMGPFGDMVFRYGQTALTQHYQNLVDGKARNDFAITEKVLGGRLAQLQGQEETLIMQGVTGGPELERIQQEKREIRQEMERNPKFRYDARVRGLDEESDRLRRQGLAISYEGRRRVDAGEPLPAVQKDIEERLLKTGMPSEQVQKYIALASSHMAGVSARRGAELQRFNDEADLAIRQMQGGDLIEPSKYQELLNGLGRNGGEKKAAELEFNRRLIEEWKPRLESGDAAERAEVMREMRQIMQEGVQVPARVPGRGNGNRAGMPAAPDLTADETGLLNAIAGPESGGLYNIRYTAGGGVTFNGYDNHPRLRERIRSGPNAGRTSDAAGRYQFLSSTWDSLPAEAKGDGRFTPENQDRAAIYLAKRDYKARTGRDLMADIAQNGMTDDILKNLSGTWEGFQSAAGRAKAMAAFSGSSSTGTATVPVPASAIKAFQQSYDAAFTPIAERIIQSYEKGVPPTQQDIADFQETYPLVSRDENKGILKKLADAEDAYLTRQQLPKDTGTLRGFISELENAERTGQASPRAVKVAQVAKGVLEENERLRKEDPLEMGRRRWTGPGMEQTWGNAGAVPWGNYDGMVGELSLRRMQSDMVRSVEPEASAMPLYAGDRKALAGALPNMDAGQVNNTLKALRETFSAQQLSALMEDKTVRDAVVGLTRSREPAKMYAGFSFLDGRWRENVVEFEQTYGGETMKRLARWQAYDSVMDPEKVGERLMRAEEPRALAARKTLEEYADSDLDKIGSREVLGKIHSATSGMTSWIPFNNLTGPATGRGNIPSATQMLEDYKRAYKIEYTDNGGDSAMAEKFALNVVQKNWGVSAMTGRVMRHPPEKSPQVPAIAGSHEWVKDQFQTDTLQLLGVDRARLTPFLQKWYTPPDAGRGLIPDKVAGALTAKEQQALAILRGDYELGADPQTEADIAAKRPPSYRIVVKTEDGNWTQLQKGPMDPYRWSPDVKRVDREWVQRDKTYKAVRAAENDPYWALNEGRR